MSKTASKKPELCLSGTDGNVFMSLGLAAKAAKRAGMDPEEWNKIKSEAMSGDYDHVLKTLMTHFKVT